MRLHLVGHDYKYAVEQIMLTLFPQERPLYADLIWPETLSARVTLTHGARYSTAVTDLYYEGAHHRGRARITTPDRADTLALDRAMQRIIKLSFYRAATEATGKIPPWGATTGIRPGKLATTMLEAGQNPAQVTRRMQSDYQISPRRAALCLDTASAGLAMKAGLDLRDICLYVGIPFCPTRCAYCSFVSHDVARSGPLMEPFLAALEREIAATAQVVSDLGLNIRAFYIGGGTPTAFSAAQLRRLTGALSSQFDLTHLREYTVEAGRPDTLDAEKLQVLRDAEVTRICLNPQTMEDHVLEAIGRKHTAADIQTAMELVRQMGFPVVNMDLIAGLPADSPAGFARTLDQVLGFGVENITIHTLARKKGAKIKVDGLSAPGAEAVEIMLDTAIETLSGAGYVPYYLYRQKFTAGGFENVGWCKPGTENLYNIAIMEELCSILSLGGGASTKLVDIHTGRIPRLYNPKFPYEYVEGIDRILGSKEKIKEFYEQEVFPHVIDL